MWRESVSYFSWTRHTFLRHDCSVDNQLVYEELVFQDTINTLTQLGTKFDQRSFLCCVHRTSMVASICCVTLHAENVNARTRWSSGFHAFSFPRAVDSRRIENGALTSRAPKIKYGFPFPECNVFAKIGEQRARPARQTAGSSWAQARRA